MDALKLENESVVRMSLGREFLRCAAELLKAQTDGPKKCVIGI